MKQPTELPNDGQIVGAPQGAATSRDSRRDGTQTMKTPGDLALIMVDVAKALKPLNADERDRVIQAVQILFEGQELNNDRSTDQ